MRLIRLLKNDLAKETLDWVDKEIISMAQAQKICQSYDVDIHQVKQKTLGYNVLVGLGYLFVGLALITLLGANWDDIPRALRMWGLILMTMVCQGIGVKHFQAGEKDRAAGIFLLGNLFYGASIILIAQIYHLGEHMPDGLFWWALGCLPIAMLIKSPWVTMQAMVLSGIWFFMQVELGFYPALFPLFILGGMVVLYSGKPSMTLFLMVVAGTGFWVEWSLAELWRDGRWYDFHAEHIFVSVSLFIFAYTFSLWLNQKKTVAAKDYGALLAVWSLRFGLIFMMVMSFKEPWEELLTAKFDHTLSMGIIVVGVSIASCWLANAVGKVQSVFYLMAFYLVSVLSLFVSNDSLHAVYFQISYNVVLIGTGIWLIVRGINKGISHYFFLGIATILITAFMRYADLIGDYIGGAILFMVFAVLLLGAAKYWKKHHALKEGV